nr:ribonuclease H-like domain-containing protein [Tanacetum cinerariifolium]
MTILASLGSPVNDEDVVYYALAGLLNKSNQVCGYMHYQETFPDLKTARSLLVMKEMRLKTKDNAFHADSSSSMALVTESAHGISIRSQPHLQYLKWFLLVYKTWHQRIGHPGNEVLRCLVSNNFILCNKEKPPVLFHVCQLGKHVRLPFVSSTTVVTLCFDIIHSDV